ncbi:hypothetical protein Leryth_007686 [Lithospermum erythrorhizon]|nr:hypothetical protein Leryth_007686 [Lithospermum erythrorhizon]
MSNGTIVERALNSLGKGFDLTSDFRLKYCKGKDRLVSINERDTKEVHVPGFAVYKDVSIDIKCDKGDRTRHQSDILDFNQMSEFMNRKCSIPGKVPSGLFNSMFGFQSGSWAIDAANTKFLGLDGYFITLFNVHIDRYPLVLTDEVRNAVPTTWDPPALARFIETYGTHIIVGIGVGGQDVVLMRQDSSSNLESAKLKKHLEDLGDQLFTGSCTFSAHNGKNKEPRHKVPEAFNVFDPQPSPFNTYSSITTKDGLTVICSKRGGDSSVSMHSEWLPTVPSMPDAIHFTFIPIISLLRGVVGKGFLSHAINLYLRYKPPIADLQYFLDFQVHKLWAPIHNDLPLGPPGKKAIALPTLQFNFMGPKLYVNTTQVTVGKRPVTGMRLFLEGMKCNRLGIHLQHLANAPILIESKIEDNSWAWRGTEETGDDRYLEPIQWKKFSHVCTSPLKFDPTWTTSKDNNNNVAFIVTGAQLHVEKHGNNKEVLHLRLQYAKVSNFVVVQSVWMTSPSENTSKSGIISAISSPMYSSRTNNLDEKTPATIVVDSGIYPSGPPPRGSQKLDKIVDTSQLCKGPRDSPGHWLVTGAKLEVEKGKICLQVKFSLMNISS